MHKNAIAMGRALVPAVGFILVALSFFAAFSTGAKPRGGNQGEVLSPPAKAECKFPDGKTVHVDYSSPRMRGRKIFGGLVPYAQPWRAGANSATTFVIDTETTVGAKAVPAGSYTLFTLPNPDHWLLIVSKQTGEWGIPYPGDSYDFARIPMTLSKLSAPLENFTISFDRTGGACAMNLSWDTTKASIQITEKK